jgi:glycosidase
MESASLDGFRLDTFPYSWRSFWSKWHQALFHVYSSTFTVGEVYNPEPAVVSFFQGGRKQYDGIDTGVMAVFDFPIMYAIRDVLLQGGAASKLSETFVQDALYPHPEELVTFIGNHDTTRFVGEKGASVQKLNAAASLLVTFRGIPQIYSGDELAMPGGGDPDNRRDFPGGFAGDSKNAFTAAGRTADQQEAFAHLQKLLRLRREHKALQSGEQTDVQANAGSFVFLRSAGNDRLLMVLNSTSTPQAIHIATAETPLANVRSLSPLDNASSAEIVDGGVNVNVAPATVAIYQVN